MDVEHEPTANAPTWLASVEEAIAAAREQRKIALVDFVKPGCIGCEAMEATTFPDPTVEAELREHFVCARLDITRDRAAARQARILWTPSLNFWSRHQVLLRESIGYLPPRLMLLQLRFARALDALRRAEFDQSRTLFEQIAAATDAVELAPEAAYWVGIAGYLQDCDSAQLRRAWRPLRAGWPDSTWAARTDYEDWSKE